MTEARLDFRVDTSDVAKGVVDLDKLPPAVARAEAAADSLNDTFDKTGASASTMADRIQRAAALGGKANEGYADAISQAYGASNKFSDAQVATIRNYETQIGKSQLLSQGMGREAAQFEALRKAGTTGNTQYGQTVASLAGQLYDLEKQQDKTKNTAEKFADTLTRRFILGYALSQIKNMVSGLASLNSELAKVGDLGKLTGAGSALTQGLTSAAGYKGISNDTFASAMVAFNQQIPLAKAGVGSLGELLRVNKTTVSDTSDAFFKVADLVKNASDGTALLSILQQAGLPPTMQMANLMGQGADALRRQATDAPKVTDALVEAAHKLDERFNKLWTDFKTAGKVAVVEVADGWIDAWNRPLMDPSTVMGKWWNDLKAKYGNTKERQEAEKASFGTPLPGSAPLGQGGIRADLLYPLNSSAATIDAATQKAIRQKQISDEQPYVGLLGTPATAAELAKRSEDERPIKAANDNELPRTTDDRNRYRCAA